MGAIGWVGNFPYVLLAMEVVQQPVVKITYTEQGMDNLARKCT